MNKAQYPSQTDLHRLWLMLKEGTISASASVSGTREGIPGGKAELEILAPSMPGSEQHLKG